jgi:hypothetical protein
LMKSHVRPAAPASPALSRCVQTTRQVSADRKKPRIAGLFLFSGGKESCVDINYRRHPARSQEFSRSQKIA